MMRRRKLLQDALKIWQAGVAAVDPVELMRTELTWDDGWLLVGDHAIDFDAVEQLIVVGAGKASGKMAIGLERSLGDKLLKSKKTKGWVNIPEGSQPTVLPKYIHLHSARPAGVNEPTQEGAAGANEILKLVSACGPNDLVLCLISGGGSALLPAPIAGISLDDKVMMTRWLSGAGADINQLNTVRRGLSEIKGGGLARACNAGRLVSLIISDVLGDPLEIIASGPTVLDPPANPQAAIDVILQFDPQWSHVPKHILAALKARAQSEVTRRQTMSAYSVIETGRLPETKTMVTNHILANNATAVDAAGRESVRLGYQYAMQAATKSEGSAESVGHHVAAMALHMLSQGPPDCLISGGEPTVELISPELRGKGGRNQQLVLSAYQWLMENRLDSQLVMKDVVILSAGTDGEDGPTDAAGAWIDESADLAASKLRLDPRPYLHRNDSYHFFKQTDSLLVTGPTGTNVCDLRIILVDR